MIILEFMMACYFSYYRRGEHKIEGAVGITIFTLSMNFIAFTWYLYGKLNINFFKFTPIIGGIYCFTVYILLDILLSKRFNNKSEKIFALREKIPKIILYTFPVLHNVGSPVILALSIKYL